MSRATKDPSALRRSTRLLLAVAVLCGAARAPSMPGPVSPQPAEPCAQLMAVLGSGQTTAARPPPGAAADAVLGPRIRLLSWNLHKGSDPGWQRDLAQLSADRDLLFLQEYVPRARPRTHTHALQSLHFAAGFGRAAWRSGVATLSRQPALAHCGLRSLEPWLGTPKASGLSLHRLSNGASLLAVNLHGVNFSIGSSALARQLMQLDQLLTAHRGPIILGGDINAWSEARQRRLRAFAHRRGLQEVRFEPDRRSRAPGLQPMDYLFFRGLRLQRAEVVPVRSSDHNPLLAEWQL